MTSFSGEQYCFSILLFIVSPFSLLSTTSYLGTFLVHLAIVLSLRKAPSGLVYKPTHVSSLSLASSAHHLHSNLVSLPWNLWLDLSLTDFLLLPTHV